MTKSPLVSVIVIDYKKVNPLLIECLEEIDKQSYPNFEVILVTDYPVDLSSSRKRGSIPTLIKKSFGHYVGPAEKRDWGAKHAKGEILAFIDDDAYPDKDWLKNMVKNFDGPGVVGVGGPGVTPPGVNWQEASSGWMSASPLGAGPYVYRFLPAKLQSVDDYPSMNLAVRRGDFLAVGGFDSHYWPGEDTKLCLDLVSKLNKKIIYDPKVIVYHHRRPLWKAHLHQNGNFGLHRGFFARILPQTSLRPVYLGPPFMVLGLIYLLFFSWFNPLLTTSGWILFSAYLLATGANSFWIYSRSKSFFQGLLSFPVVFITHFWYGLKFLQGFFFTKKLAR
jgi:glycosyltransferase involved in cell wall biosynthesis